MLRVLLYLLGVVLLISVVKGVMAILTQAFGNLSGGSQETAGSGKSRKPAVPLSEALEKDPVCGAFVAPSTAVQKSVGSVTHYFCSADCRDKFAA